MPYISSVGRIGIEKGLAQGIEKGLAQGRVNERRDLLLRLLVRRFGPLSEGLRQRIAELTSDRLLALSEALFDLTSLEAVHTWVEAGETKE